ncbi:FAD-binding protein [Aquincola sp. MAHUQ-54]|uniref:FAD-binding protein n=1 Tax=Aquincola agrisoli TaxID=3119538 RepID=A0AAW9Q575_9BURK
MSATFTPKTVAEVVHLVQWARQTRTPLYPVSRGLNWGYGSSSPVVDGCAVVDLSGMREIRNKTEISARNPVAVIEPGVTQGDLHDHLAEHHPDLTFNVTGSGRQTSVLGNALDRGVGYIGPRKEDIYGLEFVDGQGRVFETGFRRLGEHSPLAHTHPYGLGPMLDGLLSQSNFGIVTSACFRLLPRRPREAAVSFSLREPKDLGAFLDALIAMKREGLLATVTHAGNRARTQATLTYGLSKYLAAECGLRGEALERAAVQALRLVAPYEWTALGSVMGSAGQLRATLKEIDARSRRWARVRVVTEERLRLGYAVLHRLRWLPAARAQAAAIAAIRPLQGLARGVPTDAPIDNLLWKFGRPELPAEHLDRSRCGLLFINPALPADGGFVARLMDELDRLAATFGHTLNTTINIETPTSVVAVINLLFDRADPQAVAQAHRCADALYRCIDASGLSVYRARADMMADVVARNPAYWALVRSLKDVLDPQGVIAPGRYCPA